MSEASANSGIVKLITIVLTAVSLTFGATMAVTAPRAKQVLRLEVQGAVHDTRLNAVVEELKEIKELLKERL